MSKEIQENDLVFRCRDSVVYKKLLSYITENERDLELYIRDGYSYDKPNIDIDDLHNIVYID